MSPKQWGGEGVRAGQGRACPVCSQRYDVSIGGWRCGHGVTRSSSFAEKVSAAITRRGEVSPAPGGPGTKGDGGDQRSTRPRGTSPDRGDGLRSSPSPAGVISPIPCIHGYADALECPAGWEAADWDDGEPHQWGGMS